MHPNFQLNNSGKKHFSYIIPIDFLEFVAAKSKLNLTFVLLFIWFVSTKNDNL